MNTVLNLRVPYNADEILEFDLLSSRRHRRRRRRRHHHHHHHHHHRAKHNKQVRCILRTTRDMLPIFHVKSRLNFWKISVQFLKILYVKATHEHDT